MSDRKNAEMVKILDEKKNIKVGALISYITLFANICINIFYTPYLLNAVGDKNYGLWSFVVSITSWFNVAVYALYDSYVRFSTIEKNENGCEDRTNSIYLKLLSILAIIIAIIACIILFSLHIGVIPLSNYSNYEKKIILLLFTISTIQVLATTILSLFKLFNEYKNNFIYVIICSLLISISTTVLSVVSIIIQPSIVIVASITVIVNIIVLLSYVIVARKKLDMKFSSAGLMDNSELISNIFSFTAFLLITTIVSEVNTAVDRTLLGFFAGAEMVTLYQLGMSFNGYFSDLASSVNSVFIPRINKLAISGDFDSVNNLFLKISRFQTIIVSFVAGGFAACGKDFVLAWVGNTRVQAYGVGLTLLILFSVDYSSYSSLSIQRAYGKHRVPAVINLFVTIINVIISVVLLILLPNDKSIVACLIGTVFSAVVGKWIIIPMYNNKIIGLPVKKFYKTYFLFMGIALILSIITNLIWNITFKEVQSYWLTFFIKGIIYTIGYLSFIIPGNFDFFKSIVRK